MNIIIQISISIEILRIPSQLGDGFFLEKALKVFPLLRESFPEI
jgi:hypothetical protein